VTAARVRASTAHRARTEREGEKRMREKGKGKAMLWFAVFAALAAAGVLGLVVNLQGLRFERRVARDARALFAQPAAPPAAPAALESLPAPVRRYLEVSGAARHAPIRAARLRHGGTFLAKLGGAPMAVRGEQYLAADPPGFVWWGRIRAAPGVWIDGRDRAIAGEGNMLVRAASTVTLADARGPELDQGALLRLLGEATWIPTLLRDPRYVTWAPLDEGSARATLRVGGREVSATFHFGPDGLPARFTAERFRDVDGKGVLTPFTGSCADFREVDGVRVPFRLGASWVIDGAPLPYAQWQVERVELDRAEPW